MHSSSSDLGHSSGHGNLQDLLDRHIQQVHQAAAAQFGNLCVMLGLSHNGVDSMQDGRQSVN